MKTWCKSKKPEKREKSKKLWHDRFGFVSENCNNKRFQYFLSKN